MSGKGKRRRTDYFLPPLDSILKQTVARKTRFMESFSNLQDFDFRSEFCMDIPESGKICWVTVMSPVVQEFRLRMQILFLTLSEISAHLLEELLRGHHLKKFLVHLHLCVINSAVILFSTTNAMFDASVLQVLNMQ